MNSKAQIASLDFILSVVLVVVALGLVMQTIETNQYTMKEMEVHNELARIGETAADILVSHPDITCDLLESDSPYNKISDLQNCIEKNTTITNEMMGIPTEYDCWIGFTQGGSGNLDFPECTNTVPNSEENVYSTGRLITFWEPAGGGVGARLTKNSFLNAVNSPSGPLKERTLLIKIWKA